MKLKLKLSIALAAIVMLATPAHSQYSSSSYFMKDNWQSSMLNPALTPEHGYILLPVIGGTGGSINTNTLSLDKLLYQNPNGSGLVPFYDVDIDKTSLINSLNEKNNIGSDFSTTIIGVGFHKGKTFWNFGVNLKVVSDVTLPKGAFELAALSREDNSYNLQNLNVALTSYIEAYLGASFNLSEALAMGVRAKFIMGLCSAEVNYDYFDICLDSSEWSVSSSGMFNATAMGLSLKEGISGFDFDGVEYEPSFGFAGYGAGIDVGINYDIFENLSLSAAVTDFGFINWDSSNTISAEASTDYTFNGYNASDDSSLNDFNTDELFSFESVESQSRTTSLNSKISAAAEYRFMNDLMAAGVLYTINYRSNGYIQNELLALLSIRPVDTLTANLSYSLLGNQMGAALNLHTNWINIFIGADYIPTSVTPQYIPINANRVNFYTGVTIPLTRRN